MRRSEDLRVRRAKRRAQDPETQKKARKTHALRLKCWDLHQGKKIIEQRNKRREAAGPQAREKR